MPLLLPIKHSIYHYPNSWDYPEYMFVFDLNPAGFEQCDHDNCAAKSCRLADCLIG